MKLYRLAETGYEWLIKVASYLQSPLLLAIRLYWGWQFFLAGKGKLMDIAPVIEFFGSLNIPFPTVNAYLAGCTECFGGLLLLVGLASRLTAIPLCFTMIVAYITADIDKVKAIFSNPDDFVTAAPFLFLFASLIILAFGPGVFSLDYLIKKKVLKRN
jgi:putative oxidoreductase